MVLSLLLCVLLVFFLVYLYIFACVSLRLKVQMACKGERFLISCIYCRRRLSKTPHGQVFAAVLKVILCRALYFLMLCYEKTLRTSFKRLALGGINLPVKYISNAT